jgi:predicted regulator of Ras-like GTPase activity (Roadblock/LC7/MglB family)
MSPLVLEQPALDQLHNVLATMLRDCEAKCAVLVDQDGQCITKKGFTQHIDTTALAALVAGSFASTRAMAKLLGEVEFTVLFHQGEKDSIHNILVDDDTILSIIFDDRTTIGMVRLYSKAAAKEVTDILKVQRQENAKAAAFPVMATGDTPALNLGQAAADKLDSLLGTL